MKPKLIPNWRRAWRLFSVQAQALAISVLGAWQAMPDDLRAAIPTWGVVALAVGILAAGIVGRLIQQPKAKGEGDATE